MIQRLFTKKFGAKKLEESYELLENLNLTKLNLSKEKGGII